MTEAEPECEDCKSALSGSDLSTFGITEGISETIVTTGFELPNAAPIGIIRKKGKTFIRLFKGTHTWENVLKEKYLVANVVYDPLLLVRSTFFDLDSSEFGFVAVDSRKLPVLKEAEAWAAFECVNIKNTDQALVADLVYLTSGRRDGDKNILPVPNRGFNAVLEAAVHATRYQLSGDEKYLKWIRHYEILASKCGGEKEKQAMELLYEVLGI